MHLCNVRFKTADGKYENIITNLPDDEFPSDEIKLLYNLRGAFYPHKNIYLSHKALQVHLRHQAIPVLHQMMRVYPLDLFPKPHASVLVKGMRNDPLLSVWMDACMSKSGCNQLYVYTITIQFGCPSAA